MLWLWSLIYAIILGIIFTLIFAVGISRSRRWDNILGFFAVIFLVGWAGSLWVIPYEPFLFGISWIPILILTLVVALILSAVLTSYYPKIEASMSDEREKVGGSIIGTFFWIIIFILIVSIIVGYVLPPTVVPT